MTEEQGIFVGKSSVFMLCLVDCCTTRLLYSKRHLWLLCTPARSSWQQNHSRPAAGQVIGSYDSSWKPLGVSGTRHWAVVLFGWSATLTTWQYHHRALVVFVRVIACQAKTHHTVDTVTACLRRPLWRAWIYLIHGWSPGWWLFSYPQTKDPPGSMRLFSKVYLIWLIIALLVARILYGLAVEHVSCEKSTP